MFDNISPPDNYLPLTPLTSSAIALKKEGKEGEGGEIKLTNAEFIYSVFLTVPEDAFIAVCTKANDPSRGGYIAQRADQAINTLTQSNNNYLGCSSYYPADDGTFRARKTNFSACHFLMLDDLGTKVPIERLKGFELSWLIETSMGNYQGGIIFSTPIDNGDEAVRLLNALILANLCDAGASGPLTRWARLPVSINGKPKHKMLDGTPFQCKLVHWNPNKRYTTDQIVSALQLELAPAGRPTKKKKSNPTKNEYSNSKYFGDNDILRPKAIENPVLKELKSRSLYKTPLGSGKHDITCPWLYDHSDCIDTGAAYFEPDDSYPIGGFNCFHSHNGKYHIKELLDFLSIDNTDARHKPVIRIIAGDMHLIVDAAERELSNRGRHYQSGGLIVSVNTDDLTGDPSIVAINIPALTREMSAMATWEKHDARIKDWVRTDPPMRHISILYDAQEFRHLPVLVGVTRQPYFRESDGMLINKSGYENSTQRFGVFDSRQFVIHEPKLESAKEALSLLEELLTEFHFVSGNDKAAALSAILTAVVRPTLPYAPAFHVRAPTMGSGKTYLCELIGAFAGPAGNAKVSYPTTSEEATKVMLALLLTNPAVIEFDDMDTDWVPHGTIKRMLTAEQITDRILGVSKTATVSTRTLFLGSGNNVGPIRDLLRRVLTIHIDPRCATPGTMSYQGSPVENVRKSRGKYVSAALTIIQAWRKVGMPKTKVDNIVTYGGAWSDFCRHPLIWLGLPDPASSLIEQIRHDPDSEVLENFMAEWYQAFGSTPTTTRKVLDKASQGFPASSLNDALMELPVVEKGHINASRFGWLIIRNTNRIIGNFEFQKSTADGRTAWRVLRTTPSSPPSTSFNPCDGKTGKNWGEEEL